MNGRPAWADAELSAKLEALAAGGENQEVELKRELDQLRDIAREIAAFATTNAGIILIGVDDDGVIVGVEKGLDATERDTLASRIEGICASAVRPHVRPGLRFGLVGDKVVAAIDVAKGSAPIYYANSIPCLRQLTSARAMSPDEVIDQVLAWDEDRRGTSPLQVFIKKLDTVLVGADLALHAFTTRLGEAKRSAQDELSAMSEQSRALAATTPQDAPPALPDLEALADDLFALAAWRPHANGSRLETEARVQEVEGRLETLRARWLAPGSFPPRHDEAQRDAIRAAARRLASFAARIDKAPEQFTASDIQQEAGALGLEVFSLASSRFGMGDAESIARLREIGAALREMEVRSTRMDGGRSETRLRADIRRTSETLNAWTTALEV